MRIDLTHPHLAQLLRHQAGVLARRQILAAGGSDHDIARMLRRRDLAAVHPGVYVAHTGPLGYAQREWVAVLAAWPAALAGLSALPGRRPDVIEVAIHHGRALRLPPGVVARRTTRLEEKMRANAQPPRLTVEHALLPVMSRLIAAGDIAEAYAELSRVCFRLSTPDRLLAALAQCPRVPGRATLVALLTDQRDGACSVLERGYLHQVERAHGLPVGARQSRSQATGATTVRDVAYPHYRVLVELDGVLGHITARDRDADARRDLAEAAAHGDVTLRVTYGLVFDDPCACATWIGQVLQRGGWRGGVRPCPRCRRAA